MFQIACLGLFLLLAGCATVPEKNPALWIGQLSGNYSSAEVCRDIESYSELGFAYRDSKGDTYLGRFKPSVQQAGMAFSVDNRPLDGFGKKSDPQAMVELESERLSVSVSKTEICRSMGGPEAFTEAHLLMEGALSLREAQPIQLPLPLERCSKDHCMAIDVSGMVSACEGDLCTMMGQLDLQSSKLGIVPFKGDRGSIHSFRVGEQCMGLVLMKGVAFGFIDPCSNS
ncbi:hypothetical protein [Ferrimonas sp. YFM]|uniref:hypothetical protein n=1 Tax=Ferrimonas sp. YFM TaxID=3028878 RepID=UPI0025737B51|nr:hypothetical protein [Ferrimonas sp. YFM]